MRTITAMHVSTFTSKPWNVRSSPLARSALAAYALLLLYSGLSPWSGWRTLGLPAWSFLTAPVPRYVTTFDLVVNVLAYLPLGALVVFALHPKVRGFAAVLIATALGGVLSLSVETLQTFLPTRVASNIDLGTNVLGALMGALIVAPFTSSLIDRGRLADWRLRWFERRASSLLLLIALWPAAQIYPERMLFANGDMRALLEPASQALGGPWPLFDPMLFGAAEFVLAEAFVVAAAVMAASLAFAAGMRDHAPRSKLILTLWVATLVAKSFANATQFGPDRAFAWLTPGAYGGLAIGLLASLAAAGGSRNWRAVGALLALVALLIAVNLVPDNPYHQAQLQLWRQGNLANFNALAHWLSVIWPYLLGLWLCGWLATRAGESRPK